MNDREILHLIQSIQRAVPAATDGMINVSVEAANEIVELLKEREPKKVEWHIGRAHCPECGELFPRKKETQYIRFCSYCGQAVKWDA